MADKSPAPTKAKVPANASLIEWPSDRYGVSSALKREILRAAGRVGGSRDKALLIQEVLELGLDHLEARFASQLEDRKVVDTAAEDRRKRDELAAAKRLDKAITTARQNLDSLLGDG